MKKLVSSFLVIALTAVTFSNAKADVRLPAIIGSHMVLLQNSEVKIWGWCGPGEKIKITTGWDTATYNTTGSSGAKWDLTIKTPTAGGPYTLTINGNNTIVLEDILIGEVWVCSGQSNMEMNYNWGIKEYTADAVSAMNSSIRFFHIPNLTADFPQDDTKGNWVVCNPDDMKQFSLAGYFFGDKLQRILSVPVGLIEASWGGTPAEVWTPKDSVENNPVLKSAADSLKPARGWPVNAAATFNAMIHPIINFPVSGVIWYQGESNVGTASTYHELFTTMIQSWRQAWHKDFPFYYVQIAPFAGYGKNISGSLLQEAQTQTLSLNNTGMVIIHDLVSDVNNIHPRDKKDVGFRLADLALSETYDKKNFIYKYPSFESMVIEKGKIRIEFKNVEKGLMSKGDTIKDFYIAGADKIFMPATAKITGNAVMVWNNNVKNPVAVRFGFTNDAMPNLFSKDGMPVNIFRTDDWNDVNTIIDK
ncbi:MAG: sialate O-acetylesterase [Ginsengibacter sp.]